jgi:hypothetical protein
MVANVRLRNVMAAYRRRSVDRHRMRIAGTSEQKAGSNFSRSSDGAKRGL